MIYLKGSKTGPIFGFKQAGWVCGFFGTAFVWKVEIGLLYAYDAGRSFIFDD